MYSKSRINPSSTAANPESDYSVNASPINVPSRHAGYPPLMSPLFKSNSNRLNTLDDSGSQTQSQSPYTPLGTLNILTANGSIAHSGGAGSYGTSGRASSALPFNLPLPLPLSMQPHGHVSSSLSTSGLWTTDLLDLGRRHDSMLGTVDGDGAIAGNGRSPRPKLELNPTPNE